VQFGGFEHTKCRRSDTKTKKACRTKPERYQEELDFCHKPHKSNRFLMKSL